MDRIYLKVSKGFAPVTLAISNSAVAAALPISAYLAKVRLVSSVDAWVTVNITGAAAQNTGVFMPAGHVEYFHADPGDIVAAVTDSAASGNLNIAIME